MVNNIMLVIIQALEMLIQNLFSKMMIELFRKAKKIAKILIAITKIRFKFRVNFFWYFNWFSFFVNKN